MGAPLKVLMVEDSEDDSELLVHELRRGGFDPAWKRAETEDGVTRTRGTKWGMKNAILGRCAPHDYGLRFT